MASISLLSLMLLQSAPDVVITESTTLPIGQRLTSRLVIAGRDITIDGRGSTIEGAGRLGAPESFDGLGAGIVLQGAERVTLRDLRVRGFEIGLLAVDCAELKVVDCDLSDNYHNPTFGWGELPPRGGMVLVRVRDSVFERNRANRVWDGVGLRECRGNRFTDNDLSHCSNTCARLWQACGTVFEGNDLSYGIRIDRAAGEVHARDSTCVLIESGSNDNRFTRNNITHGGDGVFIRVLNGWVSTGNVFVENDTSYANNNCVESWSPGNTFIRNRANHGSYGFWLGGSDQTVLIGNEAAYNGMVDGYHNAPESGFGHGGIVIVGGSSSHTLIQGNHCHHNNGGGIVFRGDEGSQGRAWRTEHWVVQDNQLHDNRFGIWGRFGDLIHLAGNTCERNAEGNVLEAVTRLVEIGDAPLCPAPEAVLVGPARGRVGVPVPFDASGSSDPSGRPLSFHWDLDGAEAFGPTVEHTYDRPGFYRVSLTVSNGARFALAFRDLLIAEPCEELGTEGQSADWGFSFGEDPEGRGRMSFADDEDAIIGGHSLRLRADPYPGFEAAATYPRGLEAAWDLSGKHALSFWLRTQNENIPGFQGPGPIVRLRTATGDVTYQPADGRNLLSSPPFSEARWCFCRYEIPLAGDDAWAREGKGDLSQVRGISLVFDSWGGEPFTVWIDGLSVR